MREDIEFEIKSGLITSPLDEHLKDHAPWCSVGRSGCDCYIEEAKRELAALRKRTAELEAALKPFNESFLEAKKLYRDWKDGYPNIFSVEFSYILRAAATLSKSTPSPEPVAAPVHEQPHTPHHVQMSRNAQHLGTPALSRYAAEQVARVEREKRDERQGKK